MYTKATQIIDLYTFQGHDPNTISQELGITLASVLDVINKYGATQKSADIQEANSQSQTIDPEEAYHLYKMLGSAQKTAKHFHCTVTQMRIILREYITYHQKQEIALTEQNLSPDDKLILQLTRKGFLPAYIAEQIGKTFEYVT